MFATIEKLFKTEIWESPSGYVEVKADHPAHGQRIGWVDQGSKHGHTRVVIRQSAASSAAHWPNAHEGIRTGVGCNAPAVEEVQILPNDLFDHLLGHVCSCRPMSDTERFALTATTAPWTATRYAAV